MTRSATRTNPFSRGFLTGLVTAAMLALSTACGGPLEGAEDYAVDTSALVETSGALTITQSVSATDVSLTRGQTLTASVTYKNNGTTAVATKNIVLTSRAPGGTHAGGPFYNLEPRITGRTLQPGESVTLTATRVIASTDPVGTWELYPTWEDTSSVWRDGSGIAFTVSTTGDTGTSGPWLSGASGYGVPSGTFATWRGTPVAIAGSWSDNNLNAANFWQLDPSGEYGSWQKNIDIAVGAFDAGESWAAAASGAYDSRWRQSLTTLKTKWGSRPGTVYIRFAHEMNGNWYPWKVTASDATSFITAWKRYRALQKEVFPAAKLVFCVNRESVSSGIDWRKTFPGAAYVDVMSVDYYNQYPYVATVTDWNNSIQQTDGYGAPKGLAKHLEFARSVGLPLAISEWSGNADNGDSTVFIEQMHNFFKVNGGTGAGKFLYEILFNVDRDNRRWILYPGNLTRMPNSAARYQQLF
ncbi:glycoside hydrolase family 26 protein [Archangium lipolyticum]|uniref:glycoside hydrolase family 26 protein n=1 Tax=Archangium lipolyticum TaxID=2970465 RepID=UPI00214A6BDE|nr:glycosyl hydrolase [Archangium lipolyticum]